MENKLIIEYSSGLGSLKNRMNLLKKILLLALLLAQWSEIKMT